MVRSHVFEAGQITCGRSYGHRAAPRVGGRTWPEWLVGTCILSTAMFALSGCFVAAVPVIKHLQDKKKADSGEQETVAKDSAEVELEASPEQVYQNVLSVLKGEADIQVTSEDATRRIIEARTGNDTVRITVSEVPGGEVSLLVAADGGSDGLADTNVALDIATDVCERLGIPYKVEPGK